MSQLPYMNGKNGDIAVKGALVLIALIIIAITIITIQSKQIPDIFSAGITLLIGFIVGTRVSPPDVTQQIRDRDNNKDNPL